MAHNPSVSYGENIYFCSGFEPTGYEVTKSWYDEVANYDFQKADFSPETGHFTAVVWAASRRLGIGVGRSASGNYYVVAYYDPPGNVKEAFAINVKPPKKKDVNVKSTKVARTIVGRGWTMKSICSAMCCQSAFDDFQVACLNQHNQYRLRHEVPPLKLNPKMCAEAQTWAEVCFVSHYTFTIGTLNIFQTLAANNEISYMKKSHAFAQNITCIDTIDNVDGTQPVHRWYRTLKKYNGSFTETAAPFAQVVWAASEQLGVGVAVSRTGEVYVVAHYFPPGNIHNEQSENVLNWKDVQKFV